MRKSIGLSCATMCCALLAQPGHAAQDQAVTSAADAPAGDDAGGVQDIIVTARRTSESAQSVPLAINVLGAQALKDASVNDIADVARLTPNFSIRVAAADPTSTLMTIRGQSQQDSTLTNDSTIGVYVDGVNYLRSTNIESALIDTERVEVLKGPQGTLFGKNTTGGAINITTRQPDLGRTGGYVQGALGNYDERGILGVLNLPIVTDRLGIRVLAMHRQHSGYGQDLTGRELADKNLDAYRGTLLFRPNDTVSLTVQADYSDVHTNGPIGRLAFVNPYPSTVPGTPNPAPALISIAVETGLLNPALLANPTANGAAINTALSAARALFASYVTGDYYNIGVNKPQSVDGKSYGVSSNLAVELTEGLNFRSITAGRWLRRRTLIDTSGSPFALAYIDIPTTERNLSQELQFSGDTGGFFNWILGAYFNEETGRDISRATTVSAINRNNPSTIDGTVKNSSWAVFGQTGLRFTDSLRATLGFRWTDDHRELISANRAGPTGAICNVPVSAQLGGQCRARFSNNFSDYSYLASIDWKAAPGVLAYARTGRGFKSGGQNLRGSSNAGTFLPFKPEIVTDYEIGVKSDLFDRRLRLNGDIFYADYTNIQRIIQVASGAGIASLITNAAKARIQGAELELTAVPVDGLTLSASGAITDAKYKSFVDVTGDRTDEQFPFPKYSFSLSSGYNLPTSFGSARAYVGYTWLGDVQLGPGVKNRDSLTQKAYGLLDARLTFVFQSLDAEIAIYGKNLAEKAYSTSATAFDNSLGYNTAYTGVPRTFGIEITKRFGEN